jgi:uncharacterized membrane protein YagU involved in acid resistance
MSLLGSMIRGATASAIGTLAMDLFLFRRYRHDGGEVPFPDWESSEGIVSWEQAPAPALVGKQLLERLLGHEVPPRYARSLNNATHWGYGTATGAGYGLIAGLRRNQSVWLGPPFGAAVWASGYAVLPQFGVYEPIWKYDVKTLWKDLSAHLVFGTATAAAFSLLTRKELP